MSGLALRHTRKAVISCPRCLRQYFADAACDGQEGRCDVCKAEFVISVPLLKPNSGEAIVFDRPLEPGYRFFREGCEKLAANVSMLLALARRPITPANVADIVSSILRDPNDVHSTEWRSSLCRRVLQEAYENCRNAEDEADYSTVAQYFRVELPNRNTEAVEMLQAAFIGILRGAHWQYGSLVIAEKEEPRRGVWHIVNGWARGYRRK